MRSDKIVASHWLVSVSMQKNPMEMRKLVVYEVFKDIESNQENQFSRENNYHFKIYYKL